ncbi:hypothetical protein LTR62_002990 [Meristemomyces frigidus]|uniref:RanBD1 domain-containing protein n=1 Tax=Meristemomyces frigidus TaxID=1508187 RepID=A0AAN7YUI3_9PEZI|nr:hypothetical protein LTR62_002990 [Meristemomyces frigidus]
MAHVMQNVSAPDGEGAEKPAREQLERASISVQGGAGGGVDEMAGSVATDVSEKDERGRLQRKRSFEEVETEQNGITLTDSTKQHTRKRSRDSTVEEVELNNARRVSGERPRVEAERASVVPQTNGDKPNTNKRPVTPVDDEEEDGDEVTAESVASPKSKRSRLHSTIGEEDPLAGNPNAANTLDHRIITETAQADSTAAPKVSWGGNLASTASAPSDTESPPTTQSTTSASAFASSAFGSLAGSTSTGFGAIGKTSGGFGSGGSFATGSKSSPLAAGTAGKGSDAAQPQTTNSTFGGALGHKSAFAASSDTTRGFGLASSGFGSLGGGGSGRGSAFGSSSRSAFGSTSGTGLTSFASGKSTATLPPLGSIGSKPPRPFGAPLGSAEDAEQDDTGDDDGGEAGVRSPPASHDATEQDDRFHEQHIETGEEDEITEYSCRAKLYNFSSPTEGGKKEWRERGLGILRLNVNRVAGDDHTEVKARFLMRADGSHRVVLNSPVTKSISFGSAGGGPPQGGLMMFMGTTLEADKGLETLQLKVCSLISAVFHG